MDLASFALGLSIFVSVFGSRFSDPDPEEYEPTVSPTFNSTTTSDSNNGRCSIEVVCDRSTHHWFPLSPKKCFRQEHASEDSGSERTALAGRASFQVRRARRSRGARADGRGS